MDSTQEMVDVIDVLDIIHHTITHVGLSLKVSYLFGVYGFILVFLVIFVFIIFSSFIMLEYTHKNIYVSSLFLIFFKIIEVVGKGIY